MLGSAVLSSSRKVALGAMLRAGNLVSSALVSLAMMPFIVRTLGDRMYGIWVLVGAFVGYYGLVDLGLSSAVTRYLASAVGAKDDERCNGVYNTALRLFLTLGAVVLMLAIIFAVLAPKFAKTQQDATILRWLILILGLSLALDFPTRVYNGFLYAHLHMHLLSGLDLISLVLRSGFILAVLLTGHGVVAMGIAVLVASLPAKLIPIYYTHKTLPYLRLHSRYFSKATAKSLFSYSIFSFVIRTGDLLRFQIDAPVTAAFVGLAAVTHYKIAGTLAQYFMALVLAGVESLTSVFSRQEGARNFEALKRTFFFASKMTTCAAGFIAFALIAWGKPFIARWMGPRYHDAYPCLVVLITGWFFSLSQQPSVQLMLGISKHKFIAWLNSFEGVLNVLLSVVLAKRYGIIGVALGTMIPMVLNKVMVQPIYVCRVAEIDHFEYMRRMGRTLAIVAVSLIIPALLTLKFGAPNYKSLVGLALASAPVYLFMVLLLEFTPAETQMLERAFLPKMWGAARAKSVS